MKRILAQIILISDTNNSTLIERLKYVLSVFMHLAPVVFVMDLVNWWFTENQQFGSFMSIALLINMGVGAWMHLKNKSFDWKAFFIKNFEMIAIVVIGYMMLEMLRYTAGDNIAGEMFRVSIQIMTLMYPASKVFKNLFIISNGKYPPEILIRKMYNLEKDGDLSRFFSLGKAEKDDEDLRAYEAFFEEQRKKAEENKKDEFIK